MIINVITAVIKAANEDELTQEHLEDANVRIPTYMPRRLLSCVSELFADSWPEPSTTKQLNNLVITVMENIVDSTETETIQSTVEPNNTDFDYEDSDCDRLIDVPANVVCRCEFAKSGRDRVYEARGQPLSRVVFFFRIGEY